MRLGVVIVQTRPWDRLAQDFRWAEEVGYDAAYVYDHLTHFTAVGGWLGDGFETLTAAATVTSRIELGPLVASATLHSPVALARRAATVQDVSGGRLVLGLGSGARTCAGADRGASPTPKEMFERLADVVEGLEAVWAGASEWQGRSLSFTGVETLPLPPGAEPPYLLLAAHGPKALELTARYADGWNTYGGPTSTTLEPETFWATLRQQAGRLDDACERVGRDPATLRRSLLLGFGTIRPTESVAAYQDAIGRAQELGFEELVVWGPNETPDRFSSRAEVHAEVLAGR